VRYFQSTGGATFATSAGGTLVHQSSPPVTQMEWFDRGGRSLGGVGTPGEYLDLCLSSDARKLLFSRTLPRIGTYDVWALDIGRGTEIRLTPGSNSDFAGMWLPGGTAIVYSAVDGALPRLHRLDLSTGRSEVLLGPTGFQNASDVSPDGRTLAYSELTPAGDRAPWALPLAGGGRPVRILPPGQKGGSLRFSPDGRFVAFLSAESGAYEAYVAPYPGPGERVRLSTGGAQGLRWPRAGNEILYLSAGGRMVSVPVHTAPALQLGAPKTLFAVAPDAAWQDFDATADGRRILAIVQKIDANRLPLTVTTRWPLAAGK
jgi:Tol biopolymer transport system component